MCAREAGSGEGAAAGQCAAPLTAISLGGRPARGDPISDPLHPVLKARSKRSRLLGYVAVRHVLCRDFKRKIAAGPWEKQQCYMQ